MPVYDYFFQCFIDKHSLTKDFDTPLESATSCY